MFHLHVSVFRNSYLELSRTLTKKSDEGKDVSFFNYFKLFFCLAWNFLTMKEHTLKMDHGDSYSMKMTSLPLL